MTINNVYWLKLFVKKVFLYFEFLVEKKTFKNCTLFIFSLFYGMWPSKKPRKWN